MYTLNHYSEISSPQEPSKEVPPAVGRVAMGVKAVPLTEIVKDTGNPNVRVGDVVSLIVQEGTEGQHVIGAHTTPAIGEPNSGRIYRSKKAEND